MIRLNEYIRDEKKPHNSLRLSGSLPARGPAEVTLVIPSVGMIRPNPQDPTARVLVESLPAKAETVSQSASLNQATRVCFELGRP